MVEGIFMGIYSTSIFACLKTAYNGSFTSTNITHTIVETYLLMLIVWLREMLNVTATKNKTILIRNVIVLFLY